MGRFRHASRDEGASAVEFALLFPIFMVLAIGTITVGLAFSRQINVTQAAREASRYGATYDISGISGGGSLSTRTATWLTAVDGAVKASAGDAVNPIGGYDYRCEAIVVTDATGTVDSTKSSYSENGGAASAGACPSTTAAQIANATYVQVVLSRNISFFLLFADPTLHLDAVSTTPYEGQLK